MLTPEEIEEIEHEISMFPERRAGVIDALRVVQRSRGWISDEAVADVAAHLGTSTAEVDGVATFYNLLFRRPVGRHVIYCCDSVSCWILGMPRVQAALRETLRAELGETSPDGRFTLLPIQCLGACDRAPALMVGEDLHTEVSPEKVREVLDPYE